jgi:hypothetical protein
MRQGHTRSFATEGIEKSQRIRSRRRGRLPQIGCGPALLSVYGHTTGLTHRDKSADCEWATTELISGLRACSERLKSTRAAERFEPPTIDLEIFGSISATRARCLFECARLSILTSMRSRLVSLQPGRFGPFKNLGKSLSVSLLANSSRCLVTRGHDERRT